MADNNAEAAYRQLLIDKGIDPDKATQIAAEINDTARSLSLSANAAKDGTPPGGPATGEDPVGPGQDSGSTLPAKQRAKKVAPETVDFRSTKAVPAWIQEVINAHLAIEAEDAKKAGALGFMARALVIATMPYKDQKNPDGTPKESFTRQNGAFKLRIVAGYEGGLPYGIYPRLLMSWVATEAVRKQSPVIELGDSLRTFLREVMDLRSSGGGQRGSSSRVTEQMKRLFGSLITAQYTGSLDKRGFVLKNVLIADELQLEDNDGEDGALWTPQARHEAGTWQSKVRLTNNFFQECITNPVPIDLRAYKALRGSPLAMDIYTWLTFRMSYVQSRTRPITWESLMLQFGSGFGAGATTDDEIKQAIRDFRKGFLKALTLVKVVYPEARVDVSDTGLILHPSPTHVVQIGKSSGQQDLF